MRLSEEEKIWLKSCVDHFEKEDMPARDRQIRSWRRLKLLWDGFQRVWYSEVAHDWRIYDEQQDNDSSQQDYYNKPINVFRALLETIIAALSVNVPPIKCYPDDADNPLDLLTAKAGDKIGELIAKHNDATILWLHALYVYCTEGMVACYNYTKEDEKYGTYQVDKTEDEEVNKVTKSCPLCGGVIDEQLTDEESNEYDPGDDDAKVQDDLNRGLEICPNCLAQVDPEYNNSKVVITRVVGKTDKPKARQCMEIYGGLYVKVPNYAKKQEDCPYLIFSYESNYGFARERYKDIREKINPPGMGNPGEPYARWGRNNPQYFGEMPLDTVTVRNCWLRTAAFEILPIEQCDKLKKKFPNGCKVVFVEQEFAEACNESLDDHWTLLNNPLSDFLYFDPIGVLITSIQEITNDLVSLTLQTVEHGIPQTFADPRVLDFNAYKQMESIPGAIYPATPQSGKSISDAFYEVKTATLSAEVLPFTSQIQQYGQFVTGALPSLFGGTSTGGSNTASEYSMSRAQALQRLQSTWKMFTVWWKTIYGKVIPAYIKCVQAQGDEKIVQKDSMGNFANILIRKAELEGSIGSYELEANENLPITWTQRRDIVKELLQSNNQELVALIAQPENLQILYESLGIPDLYIPGQDDRLKQYDEIKQLLNSKPIPQPADPMAMEQAFQTGQPPPPDIELPSVEIDQDMDNHPVEFGICQKWAISEAGQLAKIENPDGYKNVLLHAVAHKQAMIPPPQIPPIDQPRISYSFNGQDLILDPQIREAFDHAVQLQNSPVPSNINDTSKGSAPTKTPKQDKKAPISGEKDVQLQ